MRTDSKKITWLLILGQVFFQTAVFVVAAVSYIFNITDHGMLIGSDIGSFIANVMILGIFYLVTRKNTVQPEKNKKQSFMIVPAAFFALIIWNLIIGAVDFSLSSLSVVPDEGMSYSPLFGLITIAVLPAVFEEFAFRKVIYGYMRKHGKIIAAVFSSILFGLMHQNLTQGLFAFGMGLLMCCVYEKTGRIIYTMLLHFLNNAISVLLPFIPKYKDYGGMAEAALGIIALITVTFILLKKDNRTKLADFSRSVWNVLKAGSRECFLTVPMSIYALFCIGMAAVTAIIMYGGGTI